MRAFINRFLTLSTIATITSAQRLFPSAASSTFPGCAVSCAALLQAQGLCTPPTLPTSTSLNYENCFCQSPSLQALYTTPDAICAAECQTETDRSLLQTWFLGYCAKVGQGVDPLGTSPSSTTIVTVTSTSSSSPTDVNSSGGTSTSSQPSQQSWIGGHWKYILMLAILAIGFIGLAFLANWFKRRHRRRLENQRAAASGFASSTEKHRDRVRSATPDLWGPHQHMHATKGWEYHNDDNENTSGGIFRDTLRKSRREIRRNTSSKGKGREAPDVPEVSATRSTSRRKSSRSKPREKYLHTEINEVSHNTAQSRSRSGRRRDLERDRSRDHDIERAS